MPESQVYDRSKYKTPSLGTSQQCEGFVEQTDQIHDRRSVLIHLDHSVWVGWFEPWSSTSGHWLGSRSHFISSNPAIWPKEHPTADPNLLAWDRAATCGWRHWTKGTKCHITYELTWQTAYQEVLSSLWISLCKPLAICSFALIILFPDTRKRHLDFLNLILQVVQTNLQDTVREFSQWYTNIFQIFDFSVPGYENWHRHCRTLASGAQTLS